jgi:hypothetical protein
VHPELDEDHPLGREGLLELHDLLVGARPLLLGGELLDPLHEHASVPGAVEHGHASPARQHGPEPPEEVVALLVVGGRGELRHTDVAGVERGDQALDRSALPRRVPALEDDAQRRPEPGLADLPTQHQAQVQQAPRRGLQPGRLLTLRHPDGEVDLGQPAHRMPRAGPAARTNHDVLTCVL